MKLLLSKTAIGEGARSLHKNVRPVSVVIPTYNNAETLLRCLRALSSQTFPLDQMEVIVMVDGSTDQTVTRLAAFQKEAPFPLVYANNPNQGPGPMRNKGIQMASHEVILILNDDFLADPPLVERHADWHARHPEKEYTLLGFVAEFAEADRDFSVSRLDKMFDRIKNLGQLGWEHFYTTNISLKKQFLVESGEWFSKVFPHLAYEDVEMGYRLSKHGMKLFMEPSASGVHHHPMNYKQFTRRAYHTGICLAVFYKLHPELKGYLVDRGLVSTQLKGLNPLKSIIANLTINGWSRPMIEKMAKTFNRYQLKRLSEFLYWRLFGYYQRQGVREGLERFRLGGDPTVKWHAD